jgi:hypothetical protein
MLITEYIRGLQSYEIYAFTYEDVLKHCISPKTTARYKESVCLTPP